jgi:hypothetical protein
MQANFSRPIWMDTDIEILRSEAKKGYPPKVIARHFPNRTPHAVRIKILRLGISVAEIRSRPFYDREVSQ